MEKPKRVTLNVVGSNDDGPSFEDILALTRQLTGRESTPEEIAKARITYDSIEKDTPEPLYYLRQVDNLYRRTDGKPLPRLPDENLIGTGWEPRVGDPKELIELSLMTEAEARAWAKQLGFPDDW